MIFPNKIPLSLEAEQWLADDMPPDEWPFPIPSSYLLHSLRSCKNESIPVPALGEDGSVKNRYLFFVQWLVLQSMWDQVYRVAQCSHREYQLVHDYCLQLERETTDQDLGVPQYYTGMGFQLSLAHCEFDGDYARYPHSILNMFHEACWKRNPTSPLDDERHPCYNDYHGWRNAIKPRPIFIRIPAGNCDPIAGLTIEE